MLKQLRLATVAFLLAVVLAACGSGGVSVDPNKDTVTITNDKGESINLTASDKGELPADFPLSAYPGAAVEGSLKTSAEGKSGWTVTLKAVAEPKAAADFYEKSLTDKGLKVTRAEADSEGTVTITLMGDGSTTSAFIVITKESDVAETDMLITYGDK